MGWNGTSIKVTWLRKQGRGAKSYSLIKQSNWYCEACEKEHGPKVDRVITLDKRTICWRQFKKDEAQI